MPEPVAALNRVMGTVAGGPLEMRAYWLWPTRGAGLVQERTLDAARHGTGRPPWPAPRSLAGAIGPALDSIDTMAGLLASKAAEFR